MLYFSLISSFQSVNSNAPKRMNVAKYAIGVAEGIPKSQTVRSGWLPTSEKKLSTPVISEYVGYMEVNTQPFFVPSQNSKAAIGMRKTGSSITAYTISKALKSIRIAQKPVYS